MLIQTREQFEHILTILMDTQRVAIDTETFYIQPGVETRLIGISLHSEIPGRDAEISAYLPFRHDIDPTLFGDRVWNLPEKWLKELQEVWNSRTDCTYVFHHAKFDLKVLELEGITFPSFYCTMIGAHLSDENRRLRLEDLSKQYFDEDVKDQKPMRELAKKLGGWHRIPPDAMEIYASRDARLTYRLFPIIWRELKEQDLIDIYVNKMENTRILKKIEQRGVGVKRERLKDLAYAAQSRLEEILNELGFDPMKPSELAKALFAPAPTGLGFPLPAHVRKDSLPKMDEAVLSSYTHPVVDLVLEYRGLQKALSTWFEGFLTRIWPDDRVRPDYWQHGTVTGRYSCRDPNMQQLPKVDEAQREAVKSFLSATPGFELWSFDYSQAEFRLGGCYSYNEDPSIAEAYKKGVDFHQLTGDRLGIPRGREGGAVNGKDTNFMMYYGAGPRKVSEKLGVSMEKAKEIREEWWQAYPGLRLVATHAEQAALSRGFVKYWNGKRRHFKYPSEAYKAMNSIMQGGVAEIVEESMRRCDKIPGVFQVGQVHDAIWFEIPTERTEELITVIKEAMEWPKEYFPIEFPVDAERLAYDPSSI